MTNFYKKKHIGSRQNNWAVAVTHLLHDSLSSIRCKDVTAVCGETSKGIQHNDAHLRSQVGLLQCPEPTLSLMAAYW